jgi:hypothetical protein
MAEDVTDRLQLPLLFAGQALKEMFHNQALAKLDMLVQPIVQSAELFTPPATPEPGSAWIVASSPHGDWAGHADKIALRSNGGWFFAQAQAGWRFHVLDRGDDVIFNGTTWTRDRARADGFYVDGQRVVGARQASISGATGGPTVDAQARSAIASILSAMRAHGLIA